MKRRPAESVGDAKLRRRIVLVALTGVIPLFVVALLLIRVVFSKPLEFGLQEQRGLVAAREIERELEALSKDGGASPPQIEQAVRLRARMERVGDTSNLILDPDLDSYYLADIVLALPVTQERLVRAAAALQGWWQSSPSEKSARLAVLSEMLSEADLARLERDAQSALREDARFNGESPSLHAELPPAVAAYSAAAKDLITLLERARHDDSLSSDEAVRALQRARTASFGLGRSSARELDRLLELRLQSIREQRSRAYAVILATLAAAALVLGVMIRGLLAARSREMLENQSELRAKEEQLRALGDHLPGGMTYQVAREPDGTMRFLYVSAGVERIHGVKAEAVLADARQLYDLLLPEDVPALQAAEKDSLERRVPFRAVARSRRSDGEIRWLEFASAPRDAPGGRVVWDGIQMDVTDRRLAESAVRQSEQRFTHIFDSSPIPMTLVRLSTGKFVAANDSFVRFSGHSREETLGRTSLDLNLYADPNQRKSLLERLQREGHIHGMELTFATKSGATRDVMLWLEILTIESEKYILVMSLDMTEQKAAARQQKELEEQLRQAQKLDALGTLAGGIAHDFNNILGAIMAYAELSRLDNPDNRQLSDNLSEVLRASQRASILVRQILSFSRHQKEERQVMQLAPIVKEALSLLRATLPATTALEQQLDPVGDVLVNATQVHQIVMNLCTNAAHAMRGKTGKIRVALVAERLDASLLPHVALAPGDYVKLSISDTGHGMDAATASRVFEPFFTTKAAGEGTGLGLSVVHGIVKEYEGAIKVDSEPGRGTTFDIYLPLTTAAQQHAGGEADVPCGSGEHILVVDDERVLGEATTKMLGKLGYHGRSFQEPMAALAALKQTPDRFSVLVTDLTMPEMTGAELIRAVRVIRPELPVILVSGSAAGLSETDLGSLGISEMLSKPLSYSGLAHALQRVLRT
ncbi:MAG TPA: PAS domain S-box protein [Polyangiaceae bacterium]|nr:PAS domain S-box protein [Polyangiaceae bacterium]